MEDRKHRLVVDGTAFYEIDLECEKKKKEEKEKRMNENKRMHIKRTGK